MEESLNELIAKIRTVIYGKDMRTAIANAIAIIASGYESLGSYNSLTDKPSINGQELVGDITISGGNFAIYTGSNTSSAIIQGAGDLGENGAICALLPVDQNSARNIYYLKQYQADPTRVTFGKMSSSIWSITVSGASSMSSTGDYILLVQKNVGSSYVLKLEGAEEPLQQVAGTSTTSVMSQAAVTAYVDANKGWTETQIDIFEEFKDAFEAFIQHIGYDDGTTKTGQDAADTAVEKLESLIASLRTGNHTVKFKNAVTEAVITSQSVPDGGTASQPTDPTMEHYTFLGWYTERSGVWTFDFDTPITQDTTVWAKFQEATKYTVTFYAQNPSGSFTQQVYHGEYATRPADPTYEGHTFVNWYTASTGGSVFNFQTTPITSNKSIYAHWSDVPVTKYTVAFDMQGHGTQVPSQEVVAGQKATLPTPPTASGYVFGGWYSDSSKTTPVNWDAAINSNVTYYAKWVTAVTASFDMNEHGEQVPSQEVAPGTSIPAPTPPTASGWTFNGWYDQTLTAQYTFPFTVMNDITFYAKWTPSTAVTRAYCKIYNAYNIYHDLNPQESLGECSDGYAKWGTTSKSGSNCIALGKGFISDYEEGVSWTIRKTCAENCTTELKFNEPLSGKPKWIYLIRHKPTTEKPLKITTASNHVEDCAYHYGEQSTGSGVYGWVGKATQGKGGVTPATEQTWFNTNGFATATGLKELFVHESDYGTDGGEGVTKGVDYGVSWIMASDGTSYAGINKFKLNDPPAETTTWAASLIPQSMHAHRYTTSPAEHSGVGYLDYYILAVTTEENGIPYDDPFWDQFT